MSQEFDSESGKRTLALCTPGLSTRFADLLAFTQANDWIADVAADDRVYVPVGGAGEPASVRAVAEVLRGVIGAERLREVHAIWLVPFATPAEQAALLLAAQPIERLAELEALWAAEAAEAAATTRPTAAVDAA